VGDHPQRHPDGPGAPDVVELEERRPRNHPVAVQASQAGHQPLHQLQARGVGGSDHHAREVHQLPAAPVRAGGDHHPGRGAQQRQAPGQDLGEPGPQRR